MDGSPARLPASPASRPGGDPLPALLLTCERAGFDVRRENGDGPLCASAAFHQRGEGYFLAKRVTLWATESHEYLFVYQTPRLDPPLWLTLRQDALTRGRACIRPHDEHMVSYVSALVLCDALDAGAADAVRRTRYSKSFWWGLRGWMRLRALAVCLPPPQPAGASALHAGNAAARGPLLALVQKALQPLFHLAEYPQ